MSTIDPTKLATISDESLDQRINALNEVIAGLTSNDEDERNSMLEAVRETGSVNTLDGYRANLRILRAERRRRAANPKARVSAVPWTPFERARAVDPGEFETEEAWARFRALAEHDEQGRSAEFYHDLYKNAALNSELYLNSRYQVEVRRSNMPDGEGGILQMVHLSIKRRDQQVIHDWRDLQRIKNELVGPETEGVELYPAESRCIDTANQYHLWVVNSGTYRWPVGWHEGSLKLDGEEHGERTGAGQRPFEA
jgi:hypothetical protein